MENKDLMASYTLHSHTLLTNLLTHLNTSLQLPENTLQPYQDINLTSGDHVRFVHSPAPPTSSQNSANPAPNQPETASLGAHTDFGSLTLLFNRLGGLQVLLPPTIAADNASSEAPSVAGTWAYVRPLPGHAIVNLGDAMVKFSGGILRSNIHRVVTPPGKQAACSRLSIVYFMRPGDDFILKRLEGGIIPSLASFGEGEEEEDVTAKKWIIDKATAGMKLMSERHKSRVTNKQELELLDSYQ